MSTPKTEKRGATTRAQEGRSAEVTERQASPAMDRWSPVAHLETPEPQNGYRFRWLREEVNGQRDTRNLNMSKREGYEFVRIEEADMLGLIVDDDEKEDGLARYGGLILSKIPEEFCRQREAHYTKLRQESVASANRLQGVSGPLPTSYEDRGSGVRHVGEGAAEAMKQGG